MGTEVLHPQDIFTERLRSVHVICSHGRRQPFPNPNPRTCGRPSPRSDSKRRERRRSPNVSPNPNPNPNPNPGVVVGHVTILKRGESLNSVRRKGRDRRKAASFDDRDLIVTGTERLGPEPAFVKEEVKMADLKKALSLQCDVYAGSAFSLSPSPSSLPLPTFSRRKDGAAVVDDLATKDLRRLLRIG